MSEENVKIKSPLLALVLSGLLPGLGQLYNNQLKKGAILLVLNFAIAFLIRGPYVRLEELRNAGMEVTGGPDFWIVVGYTVAGLVLIVFAMIDAKKTADKINSGSEVTD